MKPILSVITICFNIKNSIERTCQSIVNQTWQDFEWIVIDGGSTDGTIEILKKYKERINIFISEADKGIYNAMNKGIKLSTGRWISFMNGGDCFYDKDVLKEVFDKKDYNADVLCGWQWFEKSKFWRKSPSQLTMHFLCGNSLGHQAEFIRKDCFNECGLYDENLKIAADHEKNVCLLSHHKNFQALNYPVAVFEDTGVSSNPKFLPNLIKDWNVIYKRFYTPEEVLLYGRDDCKSYFQEAR